MRRAARRAQYLLLPHNTVNSGSGGDDNENNTDLQNKEHSCKVEQETVRYSM